MKSLSSYLSGIFIFAFMGFAMASCGNDDEPTLPNEDTAEEDIKEDSGTNSAYVDLGLSVKWATCNIGATAPEEIGSYYAWGETSTKSEYTETSYFDADYSKFNLSGKNKIYGTANDVAFKKLGRNWRMPTTYEINELVDDCTWTEEKLKGVSGVRVTGPNGNSIFLPFTGMYAGLYVQSKGQGCYWGGELKADAQRSSKYASMISFFMGSAPRSSSYYRFEGMAIRPVYIGGETSSGNTNDGGGSTAAKVEVSKVTLGSKDRQGRYAVSITVKAKLSSGESVKTIGAKWGVIKGNPDSRDSRSSGSSVTLTTAWHSGKTYYVTPFLNTNKTDGEITGATKSVKTP